jgi:DNA ligase-1
MLAQTATDVAQAFSILGAGLALEYKLDGARVQIHKDGAEVRLFSRQLSDMSDALPEVVQHVRQNVTAQSAILEGEVIAISPQGRPLPFQRLMQRLGRVRDIEVAMRDVPTKVFLFDALYLDGQSLLDFPNHERWRILTGVCGGISLVSRTLPDSVEAGDVFLAQARADGHEGVMAKALASRYLPGVRGQGWLKIKPVVTLDLAIVAAEWGYGRRHGWLSNYHLAARDEESGEYLVVGKTFKGPTDDEFKAMTERLLALKTGESRGTVNVQPYLVAEVAFNNIQTSPQYKSAMALRFARIIRFRDDKVAAEADTIQTIRRLHESETRAAESTDEPPPEPETS